MMAWKKILAAVFLCVLSAGCTVDVALPDQPMRLFVYSAGQFEYERALGENDPVRSTVSQWLSANPEGWEYAFLTRRPHIYMTGKNFAINILDGEVSVKYCRGFFGCHFWVKKNRDLNAALQRIFVSSAQNRPIPKI